MAFLVRWLLRGVAAASFVAAVYLSFVQHDDERASRLLVGGMVALAVGLTVERRPFRRSGGRRRGPRPPRQHSPRAAKVEAWLVLVGLWLAAVIFVDEAAALVAASAALVAGMIALVWPEAVARVLDRLEHD